VPFAVVTVTATTTMLVFGDGSDLAGAASTPPEARPAESRAASARQVAAAAFMRMVPVIKHSRCLNCHSDMVFFEREPESVLYAAAGQEQLARRLDPGEKVTHPGGELSEDAKCVDCHTKASEWVNGAVWPAASLFRLCIAFKNARETGRSLLKHIETDKLILLAFEGMKGQDLPPEPPPMSHTAFLGATKAWIDAMNAMAKFPNDPEGCPHAVFWEGSVEYTYSEAVLQTTVSASGKIEFDDKGGKWSGQAERVEDHSAKGCPSVLSLVATGNGSSIPLTVLDLAGGGFTGVGSAMNPDASASLTVTPMGYSVRMTLSLAGKGAYAGGGPACPGYVPHRKDYNFTINGAGEGTIDPSKPDELTGSATVRPSRGTTLTTTWKLKRVRE
jgi:hypothetical protein